MPRDSNGVYSLPEGYEAETGQTIEASQHNPPLEDIAAALTASLPRNGAAAMTDDLDMGSNKITDLATPTNAADAATKAYVDSATEFDPSAYVATTGDQTVSGVKTFNSIPIGPNSDPSTGNQFTRKTYVDAQVATKANDSAVVHNTGAETVAGVKTFSSIPVLPASDPTTDNQAARKKYIDDKVAALIPTDGTFNVGAVLLLKNGTGGQIADGASVSSGLTIANLTTSSSEGNPVGSGAGGGVGGTWKNVTGAIVAVNGYGYFVRTA